MKEGICMFKKIIIATDLSAAAFSVVKKVSEMKAFGVEECLLLQCLSIQVIGSEEYMYATTMIERNFSEQRAILEKQGIRVDTRIASGLAKKEISRIASEENYDLIVVGAEARSLVSEPLLGGIAYEIIHMCRKPILLIRLDELRKEGITYVNPVRDNYFQHVLFPTDFSDTANRAFRVVKELAACGVKKITLMHVQERSRIDPYLMNQLPQFNEIDESRLKAMKKSLQDAADIPVDTYISFGSPSKEIVDAVIERDIQLVILGSQGRGYVPELFLGSVGHNVARYSEASVLLIPAGRE